MKAAVVGAGAWGLPAAAQLVRRGHDVTLIEAYEIGHPYASSSGDTRLWRLSHTDALMVRLGIRAVEAWRQLERDTDSKILMPRGLLWRGSSAGDVAAALTAAGVSYTDVAAADVSKFFRGRCGVAINRRVIVGRRVVARSSTVVPQRRWHVARAHDLDRCCRSGRRT